VFWAESGVSSSEAPTGLLEARATPAAMEAAIIECRSLFIPDASLSVVLFNTVNLLVAKILLFELAAGFSD
jgi:hypothetical protein